MSAWRNTIFRYQSITWVLIATYFVLVLFPAHLHYHHEQDSGSAVHDHDSQAVSVHAPERHEHIVDLHFQSNSADDVHHAAAHVFKASPNVVMQKSGNNPTPVLLALLMLFILPVFSRSTGREPGEGTHLAFLAGYQLTPPLRAPPAF